MSRKLRLGKYLQAVMVAGDFAVINLAYWLVCMLPGVSDIFRSKLVFMAVNAAYVVPALVFSSIHKIRILYADRVVLQVFKSMVLYGLVLMGLFYMADTFDVGLRGGICFMAAYFVFMSLWWLISHAVIKRLRRIGLNFKRVALVGGGDSAAELLSQLQGDSGYGYRILGVFDENPVMHHRFSQFYTAPLAKLRDFVRDNEIDTVFYSLEAGESSPMRSVMKIADEMGIEFVYLPALSPELRGHFRSTLVGTIPALAHTVSPLSRPLPSALKRAFDVAFSLCVCLTSPLWAIPIAIAIKISSPGPILFRQKRTGIQGKDFVCLKFRTMRVNAQADSVQATQNDPRKTTVGDFLRRTSLDELPQFFNVLAGSMSIVGPRPHMVSQTVEYTRLIDKYMVRHAIKPGITGWAQINGYRGGTEQLWKMEKRVEYDVWYLQHWNFFLDIKIIALTVLGSFRKNRNAY